jgi:ADP-heptose:LPS heptosyltransferase
MMAASLSVAKIAGKTPHPSRRPAHSAAIPHAHFETKSPDRQGREFFLNHVWESLNATAKILFFAVATPLMLSAWGAEKFGLFAVANSCVALMAIVDLGLRTLTRVGLTNPRLSEDAKIRLHALHVATFSVVAGGAVGMIALLSLAGCWHLWLRLPPTGDLIIITAAAFTAMTMGLQLLLERVAAAGRLSRIKAALFAGNLVAFGIVIGLLKEGASVQSVTVAYFASLAFPLLFLLPRSDLHLRQFVRALLQLRPSEILTASHVGRWINVITASWIFQSYGLVFLISWVLGPAAAGTFFLYLKLSELLSVLGASTSEPTIAAVAGAATASDQRRHFATGFRSAIALCLTGAVGYTFFSGDLFRIWLHRPLDGVYTGLLIGLFGIAAGFSRMVTAASLGLAKPRPVALGLLVGAVTITAFIIVLRGRCSPESILAIGAGAAVFLLPSAVLIARDFGSTFAQTWLIPVAKFAPQLLVAGAVWWTAARIDTAFSFGVAVIVSAIICALHIFTPSGGWRARPKGSCLGYDTRSLRSALVMEAVDLLHPFRRAEEFAWAGPCVVSSVAGLGDLFIHLPLIAGIANETRRLGIDLRVALRPAHGEIGRACGWNVFPFDNALEDFFKNPLKLKLAALWRRIREAQKNRAGLWIDLTGSAVSALAIKCAGARKVAARVTRGGRSLVNHPLPHRIGENEYGNLQRTAAALGCDPDYSIFERVAGEPLPGLENTVILCLTTVCPWRNWPMGNFLALVERFPEIAFVAAGFSAEVAHEDRATFQELLRRENVISRIDMLSVLEIVRLIAYACAVVTNDTSTAHIANAFRKPGAVLFGPASPKKLAAPYGLKPFVDETCPFHPCVQWSCANPENWCMRKISVESVADHLAAVLQSNATYAATAIRA